jgi:hypothetical protein
MSEEGKPNPAASSESPDRQRAQSESGAVRNYMSIQAMDDMLRRSKEQLLREILDGQPRRGEQARRSAVVSGVMVKTPVKNRGE